MIKYEFSYDFVKANGKWVEFKIAWNKLREWIMNCFRLTRDIVIGLCGGKKI